MITNERHKHSIEILSRKIGILAPPHTSTRDGFHFFTPIRLIDSVSLDLTYLLTACSADSLSLDPDLATVC